jgi:hypothetical protein
MLVMGLTSHPLASFCCFQNKNAVTQNRTHFSDFRRSIWIAARCGGWTIHDTCVCTACNATFSLWSNELGTHARTHARTESWFNGDLLLLFERGAARVCQYYYIARNHSSRRNPLTRTQAGSSLLFCFVNPSLCTHTHTQYSFS